MPPYGLYPMSCHHLYGQQTRPSARPVFNSMDFGSDTPAPKPETDGNGNGKGKDGAKKDKDSANKDKDKKKKKEKKKKHSLDAKDDKQKPKTSSAPATPATPAAASSKTKKSEQSGPSTQKRKRALDDAPVISGSDPGPYSLLNGSRLLEGIKSSIGDLSATFSSPTKVGDRPLKKVKKAVRKSEGDVAVAEASASESTRKEKKRDTDARLGNGIVAPVPIPAATSPAKTPIPLPTTDPRQISTPLHTPVPLPQKPTFKQHATTPRTNPSAPAPHSEILVTETPLSQMSRNATVIDKTPIPFKLAQSTLVPPSSRSTLATSPLIRNETQLNIPSSARTTTTASSEDKRNNNTNNNTNTSNTRLTTSNLLHYKQALSDTPKPRPRGRSSSIAASTVSSSSTRSIKDMFLRAAKPYSRSGAEFDPFTSLLRKPPSKSKSKGKSKGEETQDEATHQSFTTAYTTSQRCVNFTDEREYLARYKNEVDDSVTPLPCLKNLTGCNAKREQVLRLTRDDPSPLLKLSMTSDADADMAAHKACLDAETLLALGVAARVPVPLGRVDGVWKLYIPRYAQDHMDIYASGQRTLSISSSTSGSACTYTASLSLPPRSLAFTVMPFDAPPHASFRSTTLKTVAEGYKFEVVFLGNGYLKMWIDLQELLLGKRVEGGARMEVWGVRGGATVWEDVVDELEVEGRRLCRAYDGE